jgi:hypothetical protein
MAEDTLSPVGFDSSRIVKTHTDGQERYALACLYGQPENVGMTQAALVRQVLLAGLEALGWPEHRQIKEYAEHRLRCIADGQPNKYEE